MQKATVGGILTIVASGIGILVGLFYLVYGIFMGSLFGAMENSLSSSDAQAFDAVMTIIWVVFIGIFIFYLILGGLGIAGGICAIKKKSWGLALAGAIASSMLFYYVGIAAVVLVSMAQPEFKKQAVASNNAALPQTT